MKEYLYYSFVFALANNQSLDKMHVYSHLYTIFFENDEKSAFEELYSPKKNSQYFLKFSRFSLCGTPLLFATVTFRLLHVFNSGRRALQFEKSKLT